MLAVNARSGRIEWRFDTNSERIRLASPSIKDGVIYFGASDGFVRAISTNFGAHKWRAQMSAAINAQVLVAGHYIYVGTMHNKLVALDFETGGEVWSTGLRGRIKSAMAVAGGGIVVLTEPRYVSMFMPEVSNVTQ
jgi:outer membrane protein assembly factor BamB